MILLWILGDSSRLIFYFYSNQQLLFKIGGAFTVLIDLIVLAQYFYYLGKDKKETESEK